MLMWAFVVYVVVSFWPDGGAAVCIVGSSDADLAVGARRIGNRNCLSAIVGRSHAIMAWVPLQAVARIERCQQTIRTQRRLTFTPKPRPNQNSNLDHPKTGHLGDGLCFLRVDAASEKNMCEAQTMVYAFVFRITP
jgi:hypothetical protein